MKKYVLWGLIRAVVMGLLVRFVMLDTNSLALCLVLAWLYFSHEFHAAHLKFLEIRDDFRERAKSALAKELDDVLERME